MTIVVLLAAGTGTRFNDSLPKQLEELDGKPLIEYSLKVFYDHAQVDEINIESTNKSCFPNKQLHKKLKATSDKSDMLDADIVFIALPSRVVITYLKDLKSYFREGVLLVNLSNRQSLNLKADEFKERFNTENSPPFFFHFSQASFASKLDPYLQLERRKRRNGSKSKFLIIRSCNYSFLIKTVN